LNERRDFQVKEGIHPNYVESTVTCACGYSFKTYSTKPVIKLDICSGCHPFFTGKQKLIDSAGLVERFKKKYKELKPSVSKPRESKVSKDKKKMQQIQRKKILTSVPVAITRKVSDKKQKKEVKEK